MNTSYFHPDFYLGRKSRGRVETAYFNALRCMGRMRVDAEKSGSDGVKFDLIKTQAHATYKTMSSPVKKLFDYLIMKDDPSDRLCAAMAERFKRTEGQVIYHVDKPFVDHLVNTPMIMEPELLPEPNTVNYISIGDEAILGHAGESVTGAYTRTYMRHDKDDGDILIMRAALLTKSKIGTYFCKKCNVEHGDEMTFWVDLSFQMAFRPGRDVEAHILDGLQEQEESIREHSAELKETPEQLEAALKSFYEQKEDFKKATGFIAKLTLHLKSNEAYLLTLPLQHTQSGNEKKEQIAAGFPLNNSAYPVVLVNWNHGDFNNQPKGDISEDSISGDAGRA